MSSGDQDEYVPGLGLQLELFSVHWGQSLQMSPVVTVGLYGGLNDEQYRDALLGPDGAVDDVGISRASAGLRVRWLPLSYGALRPYLVAGASYLRSGVTYTPESVPGLPGDLSGAQGEATGVQAEQVAAGDVDGAQEDTSDSAVEGPPASGFPFGAPASVFRHEGAGLDFGLGVRWELQAGWFGERGILPVQLELLYTQGLWFGLERTDGAAGEGVLAPEDMSLNILALSLNVGYLR